MNGLCFSGGGIKAAAHIGALKAIEEKNMKFEYVSGTSSGSIIATLYALGYTSDEMLEIFKRYARKIKYIEPLKFFEIIFGLIFRGKLVVDGLNSGKIIEKLINEICIEKNIRKITDIKMPLLIPMVNLKTGTVYIASSIQNRKTYSDDIKYIYDMPIGKAVRASCSYPAVISPCEYKGVRLVDGGIRENLPWKELIDIGADQVLGIGFQTILDEDDEFENMIEIAIRSLDLVCHELSIYEKCGIQNIINIPLPKISLLDSSKFDMLYKTGYNYVKNILKST